MKPLTREWVEKAEADLGTAFRERNGPNCDAVSFHAQQCAEKYIKAVLCERNVQFARIHDLFALAGLIHPPYEPIMALRSQLELLTSSAVQSRYPGWETTAEEAGVAVQTARDVRATCRTLLQLSE